MHRHQRLCNFYNAFAETLCGHVCKTRVNDPGQGRMWYTEEQRNMCEAAVSFPWSSKKPGQHTGKETVEFVTDTYTKWLVGVGTSNVVSILEDLVRVWCEKRFSLYNVNGGSGGKSCMGDGTVYLTIRDKSKSWKSSPTPVGHPPAEPPRLC